MMACRVLRIVRFLPIAIAACVSLGVAQTSATTRVEQNDPTVTYSGTWYNNDSSETSGGRSALTNDKGAQVAITFTGTGITWIGVADPYSGIAWVYLDGTLHTIDTYADTTRYQQPLFSVRGLAPGTHTLSIEVPHIRGPSTEGSWVWVDAFDIENGSGVVGGTSASAGRVEQNHAALSYTGTWFPNTSVDHSGGSAVLAIDAGSRATIQFTGTSIVWIAYRDEWTGIARVFVDGALKATVDTYITPAQAQSPVYSVTGLVPGTHSLTIEVTGTQNPRSGGSWVWIDAFQVVGSTVITNPASRMEQNHSAVAYVGPWVARNGAFDSGGSAGLAAVAGAKATVTFTGTGIKWVGVRDEWSGIARVSVDGVFQQNIDTYLKPGAAGQVIFEISNLAAGTHTLTIEVTGTANPNSSGTWIWIDAFDITP